MSFTSIQGRDIFKEKKNSTLQQLHESNLCTIQNFTNSSNELSGKLPLVSSTSKSKFESIKI